MDDDEEDDYSDPEDSPMREDKSKATHSMTGDITNTNKTGT
jgi:hypothetical protein